MTYREAHLEDIEQLSVIRLAVKENRLSNPALITYHDYETFLTIRGKGWVCEINGQLVGFAIVDLNDHNVWALFMDPAFEGQGIGRRLHQLMLDWYFKQTEHTLWLSTDPQSRAAAFYRKAGWTEAGPYGKGELKFEMTHSNWLNTQLSK
ncbi:GNAT family N-acetyltransferase [Flavisolibacter tropicus]|uniref:GCN5 family acetyltransferase n=1 Tax=Flavisolibacter tropicus TaxID=1492898 RepID=A0A172TU59_9BACT|nr:GNAT family N-acetyltransferase [Flavisolibacter tropicus]ANE50516.1 GCN5 family acetyltransferase [Flavisolibacter tropicus]